MLGNDCEGAAIRGARIRARAAGDGGARRVVPGARRFGVPPGRVAPARRGPGGRAGAGSNARSGLGVADRQSFKIKLEEGSVGELNPNNRRRVVSGPARNDQARDGLTRDCRDFSRHEEKLRSLPVM